MSDESQVETERSLIEPVLVRLESRDSEVNAAAVAAVMEAMVGIFEETNKELAANEQLLIKSRPFSKGSFDIPLELVVLSAEGILSYSPLVDNILSIASSLFSIKKLLRGDRQPEIINNSLVINGDNISIGAITSNLIRPTSSASILLDKAARELEEDESITAVNISRGEKQVPVARIDRKEFAYYRITSPPSGMTEEYDDVTREMLHIVSVVLRGRAMWSFNRKGRIIKAKITDESFLARVHGGSEFFTSGDVLDVELVIHKKYDPDIRSYLDHRFTITRVWGHRRTKEQRNLFESQ